MRTVYCSYQKYILHPIIICNIEIVVIIITISLSSFAISTTIFGLLPTNVRPQLASLSSKCLLVNDFKHLS